MIREERSAGRELQPSASTPKHKSRKRLRRVLTLIVAILLISPVLAYLYNNVSLTDDTAFTADLDRAITRAYDWVKNHQSELEVNVALYRMLQDADQCHHDELFSDLVDRLLQKDLREYNCWKRLLDPDRVVSSFSLNQMVQLERNYIDNQWVLYALDPEKASVSGQARDDLFDTEKWNRRKLTHQLWALIHLRQFHGDEQRLDPIIKRLCDRLAEEEPFSLPVVDLYIQRPAFVLLAGHPDLVKRRWIERILAAQQPGGGWNDKWLCFNSDSRRPHFDLKSTSNPHATVQALWLLWQVKYRYPEYFLPHSQ